MIKTVTKRNGSSQPFDPDKLNRWAQYATKHGVSWSELVTVVSGVVAGK